MEREALKLALDALENHCGNYKLDDAGCDRHDKAITAIKAALAQPEQEPVARVSGTYGGRFVYDPINPAAILPVGMALYAAPPAQEPVKCLDCGSHNVGIPATYDSLINSVKAPNT